MTDWGISLMWKECWKQMRGQSECKVIAQVWGHVIHTKRCLSQLDFTPQGAQEPISLTTVSWAARVSCKRHVKLKKLLLFSHSVMSDSLQPHGVQHTRLPCTSSSPRTCSNSCSLSQWCHPIISSSVIPFSSCLQSFSASWNSDHWIFIILLVQKTFSNQEIFVSWAMFLSNI